MEIKIDRTKKVFNYSEPYIIAEIGANHNGDMELAKKLIDTAKKCGADAVKFQSWKPNSIVAQEEYDKNQSYDDGDGGKKHFGSLKEMVDKYYLRDEQHYQLSSYCTEIGITFCSTPFTNGEVDLLNSLEVPFFKIASMDVNNYELLTYIAKNNKPIVLSTGMSTLGEIEKAIKVIENQGNKKIVILQCTSIYPPKYHDINLNNIKMLQDVFGYPVGFSDHSIGTSIPLASVAFGACVIEKHFTLDKNMPGWDHQISADPDELEEIVRESKNIQLALGTYKRVVSKDEEEKKGKFRRSIVTNKELKAGSIVNESDFAFKRPGTGIQPEEMKYIIGRRLKSTLQGDVVVKWDDFE